MKRNRGVRWTVAWALCAASGAWAQGVGTVTHEAKFSDTQGGFTGLSDDDEFGAALGAIGYVESVAVGAPGCDDGGADRGAVWLLQMDHLGALQAFAKISDIPGSFDGTLRDGDRFGSSMVEGQNSAQGSGLLAELLIGAPGDDDGGTDNGAVWWTYTDAWSPTGVTQGTAKITEGQGGFTGVLADFDAFGTSMSMVNDLDGDGNWDLAVGAPGDDDGGAERGAVWILFLDFGRYPQFNQSVKGYAKISALSGGFTGALADGDGFGTSVFFSRDLDGDGVEDLVVGSPGDDDGGADRGAIWILFMNTNGTVKAHRKVSSLAGSFLGALDDGDGFGSALTTLGDLNSDGIQDLVVGAPGDDDGGPDRGAVWHVFLAPDYSVKLERKISATMGNLTGPLSDFDGFGSALMQQSHAGSVSFYDLVVGSPGDDDGGGNRGATWGLDVDKQRLLARFDGTPRNGFQPLTVGFTDQSVGAVTGWAWDFGDGDVSVAQSPTHVYSLAGRFDVSLTVNGPDGSHTLTKLRYIRVDPTGVMTLYGCGINPVGSMVMLGGEPRIGTTLSLGVDNPVGTQPVGSIAFLGLSNAPDSAFPCGTQVAGLGMSGAFGELLMDVAPGSLLTPILIGTPWQGAGIPVPFSLTVPNDPTFLGVKVYGQGMIFDPTVATGVKFGLTEAVEMIVGP